MEKGDKRDYEEMRENWEIVEMKKWLFSNKLDIVI